MSHCICHYTLDFDARSCLTCASTAVRFVAAVSKKESASQLSIPPLLPFGFDRSPLDFMWDANSVTKSAIVN